MKKYLDFLVACGFQTSSSEYGFYTIKHEDGSTSLDGQYNDLELFIKELDESWFESVGYNGINKKLLLDSNIKTLDECYIK